MAADPNDFELSASNWKAADSGPDLLALDSDQMFTNFPVADPALEAYELDDVSVSRAHSFIDRMLAKFPRRPIQEHLIRSYEAPEVKAEPDYSTPNVVPVLSAGFVRQVVLEFLSSTGPQPPVRITLTGENATKKENIARWNELARIVSDRVIHVSPETDVVAAFRRSPPRSLSRTLLISSAQGELTDPIHASLGRSLLTNSGTKWQAPDNLNITPDQWVEAEIAAQSLVDWIKNGRNAKIAANCLRAERYRALVYNLATTILTTQCSSEQLYGATIETLSQLYDQFDQVG